jgi:hypothetical protein
MDSFITIVKQKKDPVVATIHTKTIEMVRRYIAERKNVFICGPNGVGKTFILKKALEGTNHVELQSEHLRSKSLFLQFIKPSHKHVFIDEYESDFKPIIEQVSDGDRVSRGSLIVTSTNMCMYPNFETVFVPRHGPEVLMTLVEDRGPIVYGAALRSRGNIRNFFTYLQGYDDIDTFNSPKTFIADILTDPSSRVIHDSVCEHGHVWDIFQENYLDSVGTDILRASEAFSLADTYDACIYSNGDWNPMPYFVLCAITVPQASLGEPLVREKIRPGSCWTKMNNYRMRKQKFNILCKKARLGLGIEELCLMKAYAENGDLSHLISYGITSQDFDVINHLSIGKGLKSRDVTRVKKALHNAYDRRRN